MRLFWVFIAALIVVGGVLALMNRPSGLASAPRQVSAPEPAEHSPRLASPASAGPLSEPTPEPSTMPASGPTDGVQTEQVSSALHSGLPPTTVSDPEAAPVAIEPASKTTDEPAVAPSNTPAPIEVSTALATLPDPVGTTPTVATTSQPSPVGPRGEEKAIPTALPGKPPNVIESFEVSPATFELRAGVLVVDGRYEVRGEGTPANPYRVPWDLLTSVGSAFDPREGRKTIPGRVAFLEGKWVRIAGYVSFPLMTRQPRELLAMLNQWDGCCIGVPPTPYDAIEVNLSKALTGNDAFAIAGTVTGEFHIRPYLMGDWLVGLYVMEHGSLEATEYGGPGGF